MDAEVYLSTEQAKEKIQGHKPKHLPFEKLQPGLSFFVPFGLMQEGSLRGLVSAASLREKHNFKCIKLRELKVFEITVIDEEAEALTFKICESSPMAKSEVDNGLFGKRKYPFDKLTEGKCFTLPIVGTNEKSLRTACCIQSRKFERKFVCIKHEALGIFEVACVSKQPIQFFNSSPEAIKQGGVE